ncbi:MAG: amidohydrolase, partial [Bacteroidia bacterium]
QQTCLQEGLTGFHDAGASKEELALYEKMAHQGALDLRMYAMLDGWDSLLLDQHMKSGPQVSSMLTIRSIKLYADGALGSRGAWLLRPYDDMASTYGHARMDMKKVGTIADKALKNGFQVCVHAIGDRANREILNQYEKAFAANPNEAADARFRIEHAQHLNLEDIPRFAKMGVIASMQGIHHASDRPWAIKRLGIDRIKDGAYVWQKLFDSGAKIINGTDSPVEPVSAVACFYASVTRKTLLGEPEEGYEVDQAMTRKQALITYTRDAAYGCFQENQKGTIETGKWADFTIFSQDLMTVPEEAILNTKIKMTVVGGKVRFVN